MKWLRSLLLALALLLWARTTDGVLIYTWLWVPMVGQPYGGRWSLVSVEPCLPGW